VAADKERDRDWDKEMKEVDKLLSKLPAADPYLAGAPTVRKQAAPLPMAPPARRPRARKSALARGCASGWACCSRLAWRRGRTPTSAGCG